MASLGFAQQVDTIRTTFKQDSLGTLSKQDTLIRPDSIHFKKGGKVYTIESYRKRFDPRKAILFSAVLPGMGQVYNKKYWKVPLVYGGFGFITYYVIAYNNLYEKYKNELFFMLENPSNTTSPSGYTQDQLRNIIDTARRQRDFFIVLDGMWYLLQLVDAHVDAHLKEFKVNPELNVMVEPAIESNYLTGRTNGLSLKLRF